MGIEMEVVMGGNGVYETIHETFTKSNHVNRGKAIRRHQIR